MYFFIIDAPIKIDIYYYIIRRYDEAIRLYKLYEDYGKNIHTKLRFHGGDINYRRSTKISRRKSQSYIFIII